MNNQSINIFIVDDDPMIIKLLQVYLEDRFSNTLNISTFLSGESALKNVDENTKIVILDYYMPEQNGNDVLKAIKCINPKTEVIMFTSNEDIGNTIESFRDGATDYVIKGRKALVQINSLIHKIIEYPEQIIDNSLITTKYAGVFAISFALALIIAYLLLKN